MKTHLFSGLALKRSGIKRVIQLRLNFLKSRDIFSQPPALIITLPLQITVKQYFKSLSTITRGVTLANNEQMMGGCGDPQRVIWCGSKQSAHHLTTLET